MTTLGEANASLGFWASCGFIDLDKGNVWPREYRWKCGCIGISPDGDGVRMVPCDKHIDLFEVPDWVDVEFVRRSALERKMIGQASATFSPPGDGIRPQDRRVLLDVFDDRRRKRHERSRNKGQAGNATEG